MQGLSWKPGWFYDDGFRIAAWKAEQFGLVLPFLGMLEELPAQD